MIGSAVNGCGLLEPKVDGTSEAGAYFSCLKAVEVGFALGPWTQDDYNNKK